MKSLEGRIERLEQLIGGGIVVLRITICLHDRTPITVFEVRRPGTCFCNDDSAVNATCGFHAILEFMRDELRRSAQPKVKGRKRTLEVAHG